MEFLFVVAALVAVKHFCRFAPKTFGPDDLPSIHQAGISRSEYRAQARRYL